jgi:membrane-associated phospholipid phosphatase
VAAGEGVARLDPWVHAFAVAHRSGWLTAVMANATWLGSNWLLLPVLVVATVFLLRRRNRSAAVALWAAYLGSVVLYALAKPLVHRSRPPAADLIGHASGPSFPSGHATQALAAWAVLAVVLTTGRSLRVRAAALAAAAVVVLLVGASRIYLGAHWLTDVLAGYALAATWLAVLVALTLRRARPHRGQRPARRVGAAHPARSSVENAWPAAIATRPRRRPWRAIKHRPGTTGPRGR